MEVLFSCTLEGELSLEGKGLLVEGASSGWALRLARVGVLGRLHTGARWLLGWSPQAWLRGSRAARADCTICPLGSGTQVSGGGSGNC